MHAATRQHGEGILARVRDAHFRGDGGLNALFGIAFPMIVSSATELVMMTTDRLFLSRLGPAHIAASSSGGFMSFMTITFFFGLIGYTTALVAQHLGAGQRHACPLVVHQGLILSVLAYPIVLATIPLGLKLLSLAGHDPTQHELEVQYYVILAASALIPLAASPLRGFFTGIGKTRVVMVASFVSMGVNIFANYVLIFGKLGFPALGMRGAAIGTVIGGACGALTLASVYLMPRYTHEYGTFQAIRYSRSELGKLLHFGTPAGVEFFLNMSAFNLFLQLFHSYGRDAAAAMTITLQWDMLAFFPMLGLSMGTTSLVGRYMGARLPDTAERAAWSGLKAALLYSGTLAVIYLVVPGPLVAVFAAAGDSGEYEKVLPLASTMLRLAGLYVVSDALAIVLGGALRGAGDTKWCMRVSVCVHWVMAATAYVMIVRFRVPPVPVWLGFVGLVVVMGAIYFGRFRHGAWKSIRVLDEPVALVPPGEAPVETVDLLSE